MFEKAAVEYREKGKREGYYLVSEEMEQERLDYIIDETFKDGAELAYNKANEWHKQEIDDIYDLIAEDWNMKYFICIMKDKSRVTAIGNCDEDCNGGVSVNLIFDHDDDKYYLDDIVWWKEITLPKESK